jgi:anti-anti-sigma regulatory factor
VSSGLNWSLQQDRASVVVSLTGAIDEDANFERLLSKLNNMSAIRIDMSGVGRINSCGVREWVNFVRALPSNADLALEKCPSVVVAQINMISNFAANARILSVKAPFVCDSCGHEEEILVDLQRGEKPSLEARACSSCGKKALVFDDLEESYFAFIS